MSIVENVLGPLAAEECRQSLRRKSLAWMRMVASLPVAIVTLVTLWIWWLNSQFGGALQPGPILYGGLMVAEGLAVAAALLLSPSMLAGTIAGEKDRGTLELLLISRVSSLQIVVARLTGRFTQIGMYAAAGAPLLLLLATLCHDRVLTVVVLVLLPVFIAFGASGVALAASTFARRSRDALLSIYLLEVLIVAAAFFGGSFFSTTVNRWLGPLNPLSVISPLVNYGIAGPAIITCVLWLGLGLLGVFISSWQLRPAFLRYIGGTTLRMGRRRRRRVPAVVDRPMLWKELYIERDEFGRWLRFLLTAVLGTAAVVLAAANGVAHWVPSQRSEAVALVDSLSLLIGMTSTFVLWLLQWSIGLRAAGTISLERERGTWDALLATPMTGREIIGSKVAGSLYALRWLAFVTLVAWTLAVFTGGLTLVQYAEAVAFLLVGGMFMAAVGVHVSASGKNPTRALATTMGLWMGAAIGSMILAGMISALVVFIALMAEMTLYVSGVIPTISTNTMSQPFIFDYMGAIFVTIRFLLYLITSLLLIQSLALRFDQIAGRTSRTTSERLAELFTPAAVEEAEVVTVASENLSESPSHSNEE